MPVPRTLPAAFLLALLAAPCFVAFCLALPGPAADAAPRGCLRRAEQRAAVVAHRAVPLAAAIRSLRQHGRRAEVVRAELCHRNEGLVYVLTLLAHNGKVTRATVDAANGEPIGTH